MTRPSTPTNNPSTPPTTSGAPDQDFFDTRDREARDGADKRSTASPDAARTHEQELEPDHVDIIGEIDNESGDDDKAPTLSDERYRR